MRQNAHPHTSARIQQYKGAYSHDIVTNVALKTLKINMLLLFILFNPGSRLVSLTIAGRTYPVPTQHSDHASKTNLHDQQSQTCGNLLKDAAYLV